MTVRAKCPHGVRNTRQIATVAGRGQIYLCGFKILTLGLVLDVAFGNNIELCVFVLAVKQCLQ